MLLSVGSYLLGQVSLQKAEYRRELCIGSRKVYIYFQFDVFYFRVNYLLFVLPLGKCKYSGTYSFATSLSITFPLATWPGEEERREGGIPELACSPSPLPSLLTTTLSVLGDFPFHFHIQARFLPRGHSTWEKSPRENDHAVYRHVGKGEYSEGISSYGLW